MALSDFQALFADFIRDTDAVIAAAERDRAIGRAVARFSLDRPRKLVRDIAGDGSDRLSPPAEWDDEVSSLLRIEYPVGESPPVWLGNEDYGIYEAPAGKQIIFGQAPDAGGDVRVTFTAGHTLDAGTDTIPDWAQQAVAAYAAGMALEQLAAHHGADGSPTIAADSVDHQSKSDRYRRLAARLQDIYFNTLGIKRGRTRPASAIVDMDLASGQAGQDLMFHKRARR